MMQKFYVTTTSNIAFCKWGSVWLFPVGTGRFVSTMRAWGVGSCFGAHAQPWLVSPGILLGYPRLQLGFDSAAGCSCLRSALVAVLSSSGRRSLHSWSCTVPHLQYCSLPLVCPLDFSRLFYPLKLLAVRLWPLEFTRLFFWLQPLGNVIFPFTAVSLFPADSWGPGLVVAHGAGWFHIYR